MGSEDKLTKEQRVRLESFAQAVSVVGLLHSVSRPAGVMTLQNVFTTAEQIEVWLKKAVP